MKRTVIFITIILITMGITYFSYNYLTGDFYLNRDNNIITIDRESNETVNVDNNNTMSGIK